MSLIKTHPDFKSIIPSVQNAEKMNHHLGEVLYYQYTFERGTTPWEMYQWDYKDLLAFEIDLERVDRLYHIEVFKYEDPDRIKYLYEMIGRMQYKGEPLYIELNASCNSTCFEYDGEGNIFISRDANLFMKHVLKSNNKKDLIYKSLADDGIEVKEEWDCDVKTHPNFKSVISSVVNAEKMNDYLSYALLYQDMFERRTTPWEMNQWNYDDLQAIEIDLERVDRLYHIKISEESGDRIFEMIGRMQYNEEILYVKLYAGCDSSGFSCHGGGNIFISRDPNLFMKQLFEFKVDKYLIYKSLADDGIEVEEEEQSEFDSVREFPQKNHCQ